MSESTLKPCPFCGNEKVTVNTKAKGYFVKQNARRAGKDTSNYTCRCTKCGAKGPLKHSEAEAAAAWNDRTWEVVPYGNGSIVSHRLDGPQIRGSKSDKADAICERALATWGDKDQIEMAIEEMAELTVALQHLKRGRPTDVFTEVADVSIMMRQLRILFGPAEIDSNIDTKLARLETRLNMRPQTKDAA